MAAFLCWLGVRVLEMHRILRDDGSIYLHIDSTAHAYVKALMDAIFGAKNFRNEIVWRIGWVSGYKTQKRGWIRNHDTLLYYVMSDKANQRFNKEYLPYPPGYLRRDGNPPKGKGIPIEDTWNCSAGDILDSIMIKSFSTEKTGYPTQKPLALYERIIKASSNPGDMVLDPFCGCATTPVAAERLGRQWVGMDIWDGAYQVVLDRLATEGLAVPNASGIQLGQQTLTFANITYSVNPSPRTDADEIVVPDLRLRIQRPREPWERLTNREVRSILEQAQATENLIGCAGCGRVLEGEFMELDHLQPKAENGPDHLLNRILLCRPCNGRKSNQLTMAGLRRENNRAGWMRNGPLAEQIQQRALLRATLVRDNWYAPGFRWDT